MNTFQFNNCGVCINPEVVFHYKDPKALAWDYVELRICQNPTTGLWDFGLNYSGGSSPCTENCAKYKTRDEVIRVGFEKLFSNLEGCLGSELTRNIPKYLKLVKDRLLYVTNQSPLPVQLNTSFAGSQLSMF